MPDTTPPAPSAETAASPAVSQPAAAPQAPASSLQKPQDQITERVKAAKNPLELREALAELNAPVRETPPPAETPAPAEIPAEAAPATPEAETPAEPAAETPETPAEAEPPEDPKGTNPDGIPTAKQMRINPLEDDKAGRLAALFMRKDSGLTLRQALTAAEKQLGITPVAPETPAAKPDPAAPAAGAKSELPKTVEDVDSAITVLEAERTKAATELRMEDYDKIAKNIRQLDLHRNKLERDAEKTQQASAAAYDTQFDQAHARATELYADAAKPDSAFGQRMKEIDTALKETEDPRFFAPNKPMLIAQMVAAELNIAPRKKGAPAAPAPKPVAPATPPKPKQVLPGGGSGTTPPAPKKDAAVAKVESAKSPLELRNALKEMGVSL